MVTAIQCKEKWGDPEKESGMKLWIVPREMIILIPEIPGKIYCNALMIEPLKAAFNSLIDGGLQEEVKTWDGCFNIRKKKGQLTMSVHSWGLAIDLNAAWNRMGQTPTLSPEFVQCFKDAGFDWGGDWKTPDGMHFQLAKI